MLFRSIICIVGNKIGMQKGVLDKIFVSLATIPIRMVSCGGSHNNISMLIDTQWKNEALSCLNEGIFGLK